MTTTKFEDAFPGTHVTSWTDDEGFDMVTIGVPAGVDHSVLWVGEYEEVLHVWDMIDGHVAPYMKHPLYVALDAHLERVAEAEHDSTYLAAGDGSALRYFTENSL